jgi:hypothetical protein
MLWIERVEYYLNRWGQMFLRLGQRRLGERDSDAQDGPGRREGCGRGPTAARGGPY